MIDAKYSMKYSFPHSVVHINDNSKYAAENGIVYADDPSLLSTIVVTGSPMGLDNRIVDITSSDVVNVAYGIGDLTSAEIKKYGQTVTYPSSLISQGVPVKMLRITPDDATYAIACLVVLWRKDDSDNKIHVKFSTKEVPSDFDISRYKNTDRINTALVKYFEKDNVEDSGYNWKQRAFINYISAGRGSAYNDLIVGINMILQSGRPSNVQYEFVTIDTKTDNIIERFTASLINENNSGNNPIDNVNTVVNRRVEGSSVIVPYLNETAVRLIYNDYYENYQEQKETGLDEYTSNVFKTLNINTFDPIYGNWIYRGTDRAQYLPYLEIEMFDSEIPQLQKPYKLYGLDTGEDSISERYMYDELQKKVYGVSREGDSVYIGDLYLLTSNTSSPKISIVSSINQYTGNISSITFSRVYGLNVDADDATKSYKYLDFSTSERISGYVSDIVMENGVGTSASITNQPDGSIIAGSIKKPDGTIEAGFNLYMIEKTNTGSTATYTLHPYPTGSLYFALDRTSHSSGIVGTGNVFGWSLTEADSTYPGNGITDNALSKPGFGCVYTKKTVSEEDGVVSYETNVYVNDYNRTSADTTEGTNQIVIADHNNLKIGNVPSAINNTELQDVIGEYYDVILYGTDNIEPWKPETIEIKNSMSGFRVGDVVALTALEINPSTNQPYTEDYWKATEISDDDEKSNAQKTRFESVGTKFTVKYVDGDGYIVAFEPVDDNKEYSYSEYEVIKKYLYDDESNPKPLSCLSWRRGDGNISFLQPGNLTVTITNDITYVEPDFDKYATKITRYIVTGSQGSILSAQDTKISIPEDYYAGKYGVNPSTEEGGIRISGGSTGFFDKFEGDMNSIEYKWKYSELLVKAYRGEIDKRILSPTRVPAKFLFDGGTNTVIGTTLLPYLKYKAEEIINASTIFTDEEKDDAMFNSNDVLRNLPDVTNTDIDVKQAMYDLMIQRVYQGIPEDKRPIGPGSGLSLHLDSGLTEGETVELLRRSFNKRFDNPNCSWEIGGWNDAQYGLPFTYVKQIADNLFTHIKNNTINKPYVGKYTVIPRSRYTSFFPEIDSIDWEDRETVYKSGGNSWIVEINGDISRRSQITLLRNGDTSDLLQESNMRTLSQLVYLLQNKIDSYLLEYSDDSTLKTLSDDVNNMFSNWVGNLVDDLNITFVRDINVDGGDIVICYCNVVFRGLILRVPIIVNVNRRD